MGSSNATRASSPTKSPPVVPPRRHVAGAAQQQQKQQQQQPRRSRTPNEPAGYNCAPEDMPPARPASATPSRSTDSKAQVGPPISAGGDWCRENGDSSVSDESCRAVGQDKGDYWRQQQPDRLQGGVCGANMMLATLAGSPQRQKKQKQRQKQKKVKTTRVRINSISEQIEDPNWLIQLEQLHSQQHQKRGLRLLHRKLMSKIIGSNGILKISSVATTNCIVGQNAQACDGQQISSGRHNINTDTLNQCQTNNLAPPLVVTLNKRPVSILKQPGGGNNGQLTGGSQRNSANRSSSPSIGSTSIRQHRQTTISGRDANKSASSSQQSLAVAITATATATTTTTTATATTTTSTSSRRTPTSSNSNNHKSITVQNDHHQQAKCHSNANQTSNVQSNQPHTQAALKTGTICAPTGAGKPQNVDSGGGGASGVGRQQMQTQPLGAILKPVPICVDGQVQVSGWKRNNLLAKTLSHFDAIRGNQRPVFKPTKISLPQSATVSPTSDGANATAAASAQKFVHIVRDAIIKKKQIVSQQQHQQNQPAGRTNSNLPANPGKRASDASSNNQAQTIPTPTTSTTTTPNDLQHLSPKLAPTSANSRHRQHRSASADPSLASGQLGIAAHGTAPSTSTTRREHRASHVHVTQTTPTTTANQQQHHQQQQQHHRHHEPMAMAQILAAASGETSAQPNSSRALKLQIKNEQVLQNLRRQSNEKIMPKRHADHSQQQGTAAAAADDQTHHLQTICVAAPSTPRRDWRRLTNKLGLLTGRGHHNRSGSGGSDSVGAPNSSLRLTVSNQESSGGGGWRPGAAASPSAAGSPKAGRFLSPIHKNRQTASTSAQQLASSNSDARKLSSYSIVVLVGQSARATAASASPRPRTGSQTLVSASSIRGTSRLGSSVLPLNFGGNLRRSSDSDTYNHEATGTITTTTAGQTSAPGASSGPPACAIRTQEPSRPVVVVNRDDLLHLIQVTSTSSCLSLCTWSPTASTAGACAAPASSLSSTTSLPSSTSSFRGAAGALLDRAPATTTTTNGRPIGQILGTCLAAVQASETTVATDAATADGQQASSVLVAGKTANLITSAQLAGAIDDRGERRQLASGSESPPTLVVPSDNPGQRPPERRLENLSAAKSSQKSHDHHLNWAVRRSIQTAVFQHRLRNMRWNLKRRADGNQLASKPSGDDDKSDQDKPKLFSLDDTKRQQNGTANTTTAHQQLQRRLIAREAGDLPLAASAKIKSGDVSVDPMLIGDAIEIYLRTTMQHQ